MGTLVYIFEAYRIRQKKASKGKEIYDSVVDAIKAKKAVDFVRRDIRRNNQRIINSMKKR